MIFSRVARRLSQKRFIGEMRELVTIFMQDAFVRGVRDGGANIQALSELEPDEMDVLNKLTIEQNAHVPSFARELYQGIISDSQAINQRVPLWVNKGLKRAYQAGLTVGRKNQMLMWVLGLTEKHCPTCLAASDQVHRASTWQRAGITPQSDALVCGGFNCDCTFEVTTEPARGRLDRIPKR